MHQQKEERNKTPTDGVPQQYEQTGDDIELPSEDTAIDGVVGTLGIGWSL